jgi:ribosomal protein S18 acetylase RimI-like enzyme
MMLIRPAMLADLHQLSALLQQGVTCQRQITPFFELVPRVNWERFARAKLQNPQERILVAVQDERLAGYIIMRVPHSPPEPYRHTLRQLLKRFWRRPLAPEIVQPRRVGWIEDCYVQPEVRRHRIGRALVHAGLAWLQAQHVARVELAVLVANRSGLAFWEQQGFAPLRLLMAKEID